MSRFYFNVLNQESYTIDEVGRELRNAEAARDEAANAAGEILTSDLRQGKTDIKFEVQIDDQDRNRIMTLPVTGTVDHTPN